MSNKIFISYRREDSAANALGIGQYLENHFGRKNVFIDVDMRAGAKFPIVLAERLAECKVMLVLIGPAWLNAHDDKGQRRLDYSDDWVRLEIAEALKRKITVIPVRVNGTALPPRETLPNDIQGLLDHQAISVTTIGFRNDMAGLARDIRAIPGARINRMVAAIAVSVMFILLVATMFGFAYKFGLFAHGRSSSSEVSQSDEQRNIWSSNPGEWVMFAADNNSPAFAYYYKPSSVKAVGDNIVYDTRFPLKSANTNTPSERMATNEEDTTVVSCKTPTWAQAQVTYYNQSGEIVSHFKRADPETLDLSKIGQAFNSGSILSLAQHLVCDAQLRTPLLTKPQLADMKFPYLSPTPTGDGDYFYGPKSPIQNSKFQFESVFITKFHEEQPMSSLFPGQMVRGLPSNYRAAANLFQGNCPERKIQILKTEYFESDGNLIDVVAPLRAQPIDVKEGSALGLWLDLECVSPTGGVSGTYEGTNKATYEKGGTGEQKILVTVKQNGDDVAISFETPTGGQGSGGGKLTGTEVSLSLKSTAPECPGSYQGSAKFNGDTMSWSYKGEDCGGAMEGKGTAKRTKG